MRMRRFRDQNSPIARNKNIFGKTINTTFMYLLALYSAKLKQNP